LCFSEKINSFNDINLRDYLFMNKRILVIEDVKINRELAAAALRKAGYDTIDCSTGNEGIKKAISEKPDLILSDFGLEDIDGKQIVESLRNHDATKNIPIVLLTAYMDQKKNFKPGEISAFLVKPVSPNVLIELVNRLMKV